MEKNYDNIIEERALVVASGCPYTKDEIRMKKIYGDAFPIFTEDIELETLETQTGVELQDNPTVESAFDTEKECSTFIRREPEKENYDLYVKLMKEIYYHNGVVYSHPNQNPVGDDMEILKQLIGFEYWKPRYLLDHGRKVAFEIMGDNMCWKYFSVDDIDWDSMKELDKAFIDIARQLWACYPSVIHNYDHDVAIVEWQLSPEESFWMEKSGYSMTHYDIIRIYGVIDKNMNVLTKFRYIGSDNIKQLKKMKEEAQKISCGG